MRAAFSATDGQAQKAGSTAAVAPPWLEPGSPPVAKSKMATFELYLIADKAAAKR